MCVYVCGGCGDGRVCGCVFAYIKKGLKWSHLITNKDFLSCKQRLRNKNSRVAAIYPFLWCIWAMKSHTYSNVKGHHHYHCCPQELEHIFFFFCFLLGPSSSYLVALSSLDIRNFSLCYYILFCSVQLFCSWRPSLFWRRNGMETDREEGRLGKEFGAEEGGQTS